jgi:hypothetical protein
MVLPDGTQPVTRTVQDTEIVVRVDMYSAGTNGMMM